MAESLWWVMQQMCLLRENRKIILIITDGEPDSIPAAQEAFKQAQKKGFECYGLGIMCSNIATCCLMPAASLRRFHSLLRHCSDCSKGP